MTTPAPTPAPAPTPTPAPATTTTAVRWEQDNPAVRSAGTWYPSTGAPQSGGSAVQARDHGSQVQFTFTGTGVQWIGYRDPWSGVARVYLDGALMATIDTYSAATKARAVVYSANGLSNTAHDLTLVVTGRNRIRPMPSRSRSTYGEWVWGDAFDVAP